MKLLPFLITLLIATSVSAQLTGPAEWNCVQTNAIRSWCETHQKKASATYRVFPGAVADLEKREVRLLAESVGHRAGITTEFLLVGPLSDRGYESMGITVAKPSDIVRALESLGIARGGCVASIPARFWPYGEHFSATYICLDRSDTQEHPISDLLQDTNPQEPLVGKDGIVFTGGKWADGGCMTDTNMPCSVVSLYNDFSTVFDLPARVGQSEVYGRLSTKARFPKGALFEFIFRPLLPADGKARMMPLDLNVQKTSDGLLCEVKDKQGKELKKLPLKETILWLRSQSEKGREPYITIAMDEKMTLSQAVEYAKVFSMLDGKGLKLDGKPKGGVYPMAYLPQEKWHERKDRVPQPFELHVSRNAEGKIQRRLTFIEEDWNVEGLDPKLTPKDYPFQEWSEFAPLVKKVGGPDNKVNLLFIYGPADMPLGELLPGARAVSKKLPLVYLFTE